jgi:hypothetical protein
MRVIGSKRLSIYPFIICLAQQYKWENLTTFFNSCEILAAVYPQEQKLCSKHMH